MIEIEFEKPTVTKCACCGGKTTRLTRFVYQDNHAFAVYYLLFTEGHNEKVAEGLIGLGQWGEDGAPEKRTAFPFRIWTTEKNYHVGLMDARDSVWGDVTFLGRVLDREEALKHEWIQDVYHITDHIVMEDREVISYFNESV